MSLILKRRPVRLEGVRDRYATSFVLYSQTPIVLLISLLFGIALLPGAINADHNVSDVEFPAVEEMASSTAAFNKLTALSEKTPRVVVFSNQLYRLRLLGLNSPVPGTSFSHVASVAGYPDLPRWTFLRAHNNDLLLYGSHSSIGPVNIQIISTNQQTFDVNIRQLQLQVQPREISAPYEVEMKIINYNVEDVFEREILPRLERVVRALWSTSPVVFTSKLASVLDVGGRRPLDPRHKEGFIVRVAGSGNFSFELRSLELEVRQLRNRIPCPRDYKRTSAEWRFREIGLVPDWCGFRLITNTGLSVFGDINEGSSMPVPVDNGSSSTRSSQLAAAAASDVTIGGDRPPLVPPRSYDGEGIVSQEGNGTTNGERSDIGLVPPPFEGPSIQDLPRRSSFEDVVVSLALPLAVCLLLLGGLSGTSLCLYASDEPTRSNTTTYRQDSVDIENIRRPNSFRHGKN